MRQRYDHERIDGDVKPCEIFDGRHRMKAGLKRESTSLHTLVYPPETSRELMRVIGSLLNSIPSQIETAQMEQAPALALLEYLGRASAVLMDDAVSSFQQFSKKLLPEFLQLNEKSLSRA